MQIAWVVPPISLQPTMHREPTHPLAEHPLAGLTSIPTCQFSKSNGAYLSALMLEASLLRCQTYVKGELLDVGCGWRPYEKTYFAGASKYVGLDLQTDRSKPDLIGTALDIPAAGESFDTVVCTEVLEHVPDPLRALREMRRVIRNQGHLILTVPMYWPRHDLPYDFYRYTYDGLLYLLKETQWELVKLYNRGHSFAFLGQVISQVGLFYWHPKPLTWFLNNLFLQMDLHRRHDILTMGWTVVAKPQTR